MTNINSYGNYRGVEMLIKRKKLWWIIAIVAFVLVIVSLSAVLVATNDIMNEGVIVIDAGHGGIDGGVTYGDMVEAEINLEISKLLKEKLEKLNYNVIMTRKDEKSLGANKKEDMANRAKIIKRAMPDMVVSIHVNKYVNTSRRGVQVFYDDTGRNQKYAENMQGVINSRINSKYAKRTDLACLKGDYFITKCSDYPSVIVETGFISNEEDRKLLKDNKFREELCDSIIDSIISNCMSIKYF